MTKPPPKHKDRPSWTMPEVIEHMQTGNRPVSTEYADYLRDAAEAAGLAAEDLGLPPVPLAERSIEDLSMEDLIERTSTRNRY